MLTGSFISKTNTKYDVTIGTQQSGELLFGSDPFTLCISQKEFLFSPLRKTVGTLRILTDSLLPVFSSAFDIPVTVKQGTTVIFNGYVSPNTFNQPFPSSLQEVEITCDDYITSLEHKKVAFTSMGIHSFNELIMQALNASGHSYTLQVHSFSDKALTDLYICDQNWFDESGEGMSYKEMLSHILQFCGLVGFAWGDKFYCIDYNLIKSGQCFNSTLELLNKTTYALDVSYQEVYNQMSIKSSLYNFETYIPELLSRSDLRTIAAMNGGAEVSHELGTSTYVYQKLNSTKWTIGAGNLYRGFNYTTGDGRPAQNNWEYFWERADNATAASYCESEQTYALGGGYLALDFNLMCSDFDVIGIPTAKKNPQEVHPVVNVMLQIGNLYYSTQGWTTAASTFVIDMGKGKTREWMDCPDTNTYENHVDLKGYTIAMPTTVAVGKIKLTINAINSLNVTSPIPLNYVKHILLRNLTLKYRKSKPVEYLSTNIDEDSNTDTLYTTSIDANAVTSAEDIELKVATNSKKGPSFASVLIKTGTNYQFLETIKNTALDQTALQEENLLDSYVTQYSQPAICINVEMDGIIPPYTKITDSELNKVHVVNGLTVNYAENTTTLNLVEKL